MQELGIRFGYEVMIGIIAVGKHFFVNDFVLYDGTNIVDGVVDVVGAVVLVGVPLFKDGIAVFQELQVEHFVAEGDIAERVLEDDEKSLRVEARAGFDGDPGERIIGYGASRLALDALLQGDQAGGGCSGGRVHSWCCHGRCTLFAGNAATKSRRRREAVSS